MRSSKYFTWILALYCSSIVIGAGLLALPLVAAQLGFVPLLAITLLMGVWMGFVNQRTARILFSFVDEKSRDMSTTIKEGVERAVGVKFNPQGSLVDPKQILASEVHKRGPRLLPDVTLAAGFNKAGKVTVVLGMFLYVAFADIGYILIGSRSLTAITDFILKNSPGAFPVILFIGLLFFVLSRSFYKIIPRIFLLRGTIQKILMMSAGWLAGIGVLGLIVSYHLAIPVIWVKFLTLCLFTGAVLAGMYTRPSGAGGQSEEKLSDQHTVNVIVMLFEILLLVITIILVIWKITSTQTMVPFYTFSPIAFSLSIQSLTAWANLIGVVIFALVGTGLFNLLSYPKLFEQPEKSKRSRLISVVNLGIGIPLVLYIAWTLTSAYALSPSDLIAANQDKLTTNIAISNRIATVDPNAAWVIILFGYSFALLAVTSACNGFTESLADQVRPILPQSSLNGKPRFIGAMLRWMASDPENLPIRLIILLGAMLAAFTIDQLIPINISSILSVAGNAGGGLLVLILPFFLPEPGQSRSKWTSIVVGTFSALILALLALNAVDIASVHDLGSGIVAGICVVIALTIVVITFWLLKSEPKY